MTAAAEQLENPCPACGSRFGRLRFEKSGRRFWRCVDCQAERQSPLPTDSELTAYYDSSYRDGMYREFTDAADMKSLTARHRLKRIRHLCRPGRWLDIGSADGRFVEVARGAGIDAVGVELSAVAVQAARERGVPVQQGSIADIDDGPYDTATAFDVIEHVRDPEGFLSHIASVLPKGGTMVLTLPNLASPWARLLGSRWWFYIPEEHLHYWSPRTLHSTLDRHGFDVQVIKPVGKPISLAYGLTQFKEYNPLIYRVLNPVVRLLPDRLQNRPIPFRVGEQLAVATRR